MKKNTLLTRFGALLALMVCIGLASAATARADTVVFDDGFEAPLAATNGNGQTITVAGNPFSNWNVTANVTLVGSYWQAAAGSTQSLNLNTSQPGAIATKPITVQAGQRYRVHFQYASFPGHVSTMTAAFGGWQQAFTTSGNGTRSVMDWRSFDSDDITVQANGTLSLSFTSNTNGNFGATIDDVRITLLSQAPALIRAWPYDASTTRIVGYLTGVQPGSLPVQVSFADSCSAGVLTSPVTTLSSPTTATVVSGGLFYIDVPASSGLVSGKFVAVRATSPQTGYSACVADSGNNDSWPKALRLDSMLTTQDWIDAPGRARWYKFKVNAGQRIQVTVSGAPAGSVLPADYDVAVFKDIGKAFDEMFNAPTVNVTKLSAEYAPSMISPSMISPSMISPSMISQDSYSPSMISPSMISPSMISPSMISPSMISPSMISPSMISPSMISPSMISAFSADALLALGYTADEVAAAFSSAQTRTLVGVSGNPGTATETAVVNTWTNTGDFYVRISGRNGAYSTSGKFTLSVTQSGLTCKFVTDTAITSVANQAAAWQSRSPGDLTKDTLILVDGTTVGKSLPLDANLTSGGTLRQKLQQLADRPEVNGLVVDVGSYQRVADLKSQATRTGTGPAYDNAGCPLGMHLVAQEIKSIVDGYRAVHPLRYIVLVGSDRVIPFFRYPDEALLGQESTYFPPVASTSTSDASLRSDYVLAQDAYGSTLQLSQRSGELPVFELGVGRLVEAPDDMAAVIDAYLGTFTGNPNAHGVNGVVTPQTSLATGYDFLADAATQIAAQLSAGGASSQDTLINDTWTRTDLVAKLLNQRHDIVFLGGHFSANSALAADFKTGVFTSDLIAAPAEYFTNAVVFSAGCHAGFGIVDPDKIQNVTDEVDFPQAFARKGATLIAGSGYQYGDTDFLEYSERLYLNFAKALRAGSGGIAVGDALVQAKREYTASTPDMRGIHLKAVLEATLYGLPMLKVQMASGSSVPSPAIGTPDADQPGPPFSTLGLTTSTVQLPSPTTQFAFDRVSHPLANGTIDATYLMVPDRTTGQVVTNAVDPVLPLVRFDVQPPSGGVLRGVVMLGGTYQDTAGIIPFTDAPATEVDGAHGPFLSPVFFPTRLWVTNYFAALANTGPAALLVTPAQYRATDFTGAVPRSIERKFKSLNVKLFYSASTAPRTAMTDAPSVVNVTSQFTGTGGAQFDATVTGDPLVGIFGVIVAYDMGADLTGAGQWGSLGLTQCINNQCPGLEDSRRWRGTLASAPAKFIVQAVNGAGMVTVDDNFGAYYTVGANSRPATSMNLTASLSSAKFGASPTVTATLTSGGGPVPAGKPIVIAMGAVGTTASTDANGTVSVSMPVLTLPDSYRMTASFYGDDTLLPSSATIPFTVTQADTALSSFTATQAPTSTTLSATLGASSVNLVQRSVQFKLQGTNAGGFDRTGVSLLRFIDTDGTGTATLQSLPATTLPTGYYTLTGTFAGDTTLKSATTSTAAFFVPKSNQTINFPQPSSRTFGDADFAITASASSSGQITYTFDSTKCTVNPVTGPGAATVHIVRAGDCVITATQAGNTDFYNAADPVSRTVTIAKAQVTITGSIASTPSATSMTYGDDLLPSPPAGSATVVTFGVSVTSNRAVCNASASPSVSPTPATSPPLAAGSYVVTPTNVTFAPVAGYDPADIAYSCAVTTVPSSAFMVNKATPTFTVPALPGYVALDVNNGLTIPGRLNRSGRSWVYPGLVGDTASVVVTLKNGATVRPSASASTPGAPDGSFNVTDSQVPSSNGYTLQLDYAGGANFNAASYGPVPLRVEGFSAAGAMTQPRADHTATLLDDGRVLLTGGFNASGSRTVTTEVYCPAVMPTPTPPLTRAQLCPTTGNAPGFNLVGSLHGAAAGHTATMLPSRKVLVVGGGNSSTEVFDPATNQWTKASGNPDQRSYHTATLLPNGKVFLAGGSASGESVRTTMIYDPPTATFTSGPLLGTARDHHTATLRSDGKVVVIGGRQAVKQGSTLTITPLATVELYNPATNQFENISSTPLGSLGTGNGRFSHATVLFSDQTLLVIGGSAGTADPPTTSLRSVLKFNTSWAALSAANQMLDKRREFTLTPLFDNRLLAIGGMSDATRLATSEDYLAGIFVRGASMSTVRSGHAAARLLDGNVLVTGGVGAQGVAQSSAELYNGPAP